MRRNTLSDLDLWALIVSGDYRAFTVLYERHWLKLYRTAQKYCKDNEACEEIVHDLFFTLWNRREYLSISAMDLYLKASVRYQVYAYLKKSGKLKIEYREDINDLLIQPEINKGYEKIVDDDLQAILEAQLVALPQRCREIFLLSRKHYLSNPEIAERLGISKRSVENQITIALKHLRFNLKEISILLILINARHFL